MKKTMRDCRRIATRLGTTLVVSLCLVALCGRAEEQMIDVIERNGRAYVNAATLAAKAGIAIKPLPGQGAIAACSRERCAVVKDFFPEGNATWVGVQGLAQALSATPKFDAARKKVRFIFDDQPTPAAYTVASVGQLAPNFRLPKLDGTAISLSDFRGKRVLINSWASW